MIYTRLHNSSASGATTYIHQRGFSVVPRRDELSTMSLEQHNNVINNGFNYPGFLRFESLSPSDMDYTLQENEKRMLSLFSRYGFRGMGTIANQDPYPCTSNIKVECYYRKGQTYSYNWLA